MPELPEVETTRRGIAPHCEGRSIRQLIIRNPSLRWPVPDDLPARMEGHTIRAVDRRAKYILIRLDTGTAIVHLGMSGSMRVVTDQSPPLKHDHVELQLDNGLLIRFNDPRRFGAMDLFATASAEQHPLLALIGPEPLRNSFDETYLINALARRNTPMKSALLDQKLVAGLGNIYVCEALFRSRIHPTRVARRVSKQRISKLVPVIREVLGDAIEAGGSSLRDFRQADGELGYFQHRFDVYGREGQPCRTPGCSSTIRRIVQSGRSTFYCPTCQR